MAHPLEPSYHWRTPVLIASAGLVACVGLLFRSQVNGWITMALLLVGIWLLFLLIVYRRARAYVMVDGSVLRLRHFRRHVDVQGSTVRAVRQVLTPHGPSYRLTVQEGGRTARYLVPTAWLRAGHSTLFTWLLAHAPQAELDKGSRKTLDMLRVRGLVA